MEHPESHPIARCCVQSTVLLVWGESSPDAYYVIPDKIHRSGVTCRKRLSLGTNKNEKYCRTNSHNLGDAQSHLNFCPFCPWRFPSNL